MTEEIPQKEDPDDLEVEIDPEIAFSNLKKLAESADCKWAVQVNLRRSIHTIRQILDRDKE